MTNDDRRRSSRGLVWGTTLIAIGSVFMLDQLGFVDLPGIGSMWPGVFYVIAISHLVQGQFASAVSSAMFGTWFFACNEGWWGLTYYNSWPLIIVVIGLSIVTKALTREGGGCFRPGGTS